MGAGGLEIRADFSAYYCGDYKTAKKGIQMKSTWVEKCLYLHVIVLF